MLGWVFCHGKGEVDLITGVESITVICKQGWKLNGKVYNNFKNPERKLCFKIEYY